MKWICIALGIPVFLLAYRVPAGNLLVSLSLALTPITLLVAIERALHAGKEQQASGLTDRQLTLQKAGSAANLRRQALSIQVAGYAFIIIAIPMLIVGVLASMRGSITALCIALAAALMLYGARIFLSVASKMREAAKGAQ
jgi:hypothetical protein